MGLLEDAERRRADGLRWQQRLLLVSAQGVFLLIVAAFLLFLAVAAVVMVAVEFGHWGYLAWAGRHPALVARYDPHHWLSRAVALVALLSLAHAVCRGLSEMLRRQLPALWSAVFSEGLPMLRAWRRVFLPLPWERRREPEPPSAGAEPPAA